MRDIAIVAYSQSDCLRRAGAANEVELIMPQLSAVFDQAAVYLRVTRYIIDLHCAVLAVVNPTIINVHKRVVEID